VRKDRILSYVGIWPHHLHTLCSYSSQAGDCYHREKLAITSNSNTITRPPKHIYNVKNDALTVASILTDLKYL